MLADRPIGDKMAAVKGMVYLQGIIWVIAVNTTDSIKEELGNLE